MKSFFVFLFVVCALLLAGCTEQIRTRQFGGNSFVDLPAGQKLVVATWKESNLWYLTRRMRDGEKPDTLLFGEISAYGIFQGTVTFRESR